MMLVHKQDAIFYGAWLSSGSSAERQRLEISILLIDAFLKNYFGVTTQRFNISFLLLLNSI